MRSHKTAFWFCLSTFEMDILYIAVTFVSELELEPSEHELIDTLKHKKA